MVAPLHVEGVESRLASLTLDADGLRLALAKSAARSQYSKEGDGGDRKVVALENLVKQFLGENGGDVISSLSSICFLLILFLSVQLLCLLLMATSLLVHLLDIMPC